MSSDDVGIRNALTGTAHGPIVQTGAIHGDVYVGTAGGRTATPVPRQLPPVPRHFVGRAEALRQLDEERSPGAVTLVVISGPAGVGKTSTALQWIRKHVGAFPDGQLYADLRGQVADEPVAPSTVLPWFLRALGVAPDQVPADLAAQTALFRTVTATRRVAVLCDNARSAAQVRPLVPVSPESVCVVTSRWRLSSLLLDGAVSLPLEPLDTESAVELLGRIAGRERVRAEWDAARELVASYGRFPLAVCVGAALLATQPGRSVAAAAGLVATLRSADRSEDVSMTASLNESYNALPEPAARLYRRLGLHPGAEFGMAVAETVAATAPRVADVSGQLATLVEAHLLTVVPPDRYRFHDLIQQHATDRADTDETAAQREETVRRVIDGYLATANSADRVVYPQRRRPPTEYIYPPAQVPEFATPDAALAWLNGERVNLLAAQRLAARNGLHEANWQLAEAMWALFAYLRYPQDWISCHELGIDGARASRHQLAEARLRNGLGVALLHAGCHDEALSAFDAALTVRRDIGDRRGEGLALHNKGLVHRATGDLQRAQEALRDALALHQEAGSPRDVARDRSALGEIESLHGRHTEALAHLTAAREILAGTGDRRNESLVEQRLGEAHIRAGDPAAAHAHLTAALHLLDELGGVHEAARIHETLGELAERDGDTATACDHYTQAEAVYAQLGATTDAHRAADRSRHLQAP